MELATALHHSAQQVEVREWMAEKYYAPRRPKPPLPGKRPGVSTEPVPQGVAVTVGYVAAPVPTLAGHRFQGDDGVDYLSRRYLLGILLEETRQEEERRKEAEKEKEQASRTSASSAPKRTRKKRKKKKLSKASSRSSCGCARRRQRQWHVSGLLGDVLLRAVFPSVVDRPEMPCIMADMDQKDSCSGMYKAVIAGGFAPRAVLSFLVGRPMQLGIMAGFFQKDSYALGSGTHKVGFTGDSAPCAVFLSLWSGPRCAASRPVLDLLVVLCLLCATTGALGLEVQKTAFFLRCCSSPTRSST